MPPPEKKFVKYTFDDTNNKPREPRRPSKENFKQRDSTQQNRTRRPVSYTQKPTSRQNVLKDMINSFISVSKPTAKMEQLIKNFPKYFSAVPKEPQSFTVESLNGFLALMGKKNMDREAKSYMPFDLQEQEDPNWDSDSDLEGGIQSRKIDENIVEKAMERLGTIKQLRQDELKRHEKQFLEDFYRQKHQQQLEKEKIEEENKQKNPNSKSSIESGQNSDLKQENDWTDYQQKQVQDFVNMGFIQKIEQDENDDFGDDDFSVEDQKSESSKSENSSEGGDDDIFGDEGPTTIVKKKQATHQSVEQKHKNLGTVVINSHMFSRIAEAVGIPPGACIWIIKNNKNLRYKVSTQFMDEMYRLNNFCESLPYVSLNHSEFVHNNDVQKEKGLQIFKKFNARKHQQGQHHHYNKTGNGNRNYDNNKRKYQYKPNTQPATKSHLNKK